MAGQYYGYRMGFDRLELRILCRRQNRPRKWGSRSQKSSEPIFPSAPSSIQQLIYSERSSPIYSLQEKKSDISLQRKKMLCYHDVEFHFWLMGRLLPQYLNAILGGAKNLQSLSLEPVCDISSFKSIRKARSLQNLSLMLYTSQIIAYPQLFKYLISLQKVKLEIRWNTDTSHEALIINKFFGFILDLPKLHHLVIWLGEGSDYYRVLLSALHEKKLASFEIIVKNNHSSFLYIPSDSKSQKDWAKCVETLYIGTKYPEEKHIDPWGRWPPAQKSGKSLKFVKHVNVDDLIAESLAIKNLEIVNFFSFLRGFNTSQSQKLLDFLSQTKRLENLKIVFGETFGAENRIYVNFMKEFSQIESLKDLRTLAFSVRLFKEAPFQKISPPYGNQMSNLKALSLNVISNDFDLSSWTETLKDLPQLESFDFAYIETKPSRIGRHPDCSFSFEQLENLKSIRLNCNLPFSKSSREQLMKSLLKVEGLESLKIEGDIFYGLEGEEASLFLENLCGKKKLELADFRWKDTQGSQWAEVHLKRVNGEVVVSLEREL